MKLFRRRDAITCRRAVEMITDYLDAALPDAERSRLERHLAVCPNCAEYLRQIQSTIEATGHLDDADLTPQAREALIDLYRNTAQ